MNDNETQRLIETYLTFYPAEPVPVGVIDRIEATLGLDLPDDLKTISKVYSGGILGAIEHLEIGFGPAANLVDETQKARRGINLPTKYVVLAKLSESMVLMETQDDKAKPAPVLWLDNEDVIRITEGDSPIYDPTVFASYADFFAYLLAEEEENASL